MIKRFLPAVFLLLSAIILFTAHTEDKSDAVLAEEAIVLGDRPNLPDEPFDYDIDFPSHVSDPDIWNSFDPDVLNDKITADGATLGRVLFYDKKLSFNNKISCSSCHAQELAFADDAQFSEGFDKRLSVRNSPNLNDIGWASSRFGFTGAAGHVLFWDGRSSDLDVMTLEPIKHKDELGKEDLEYLEVKLPLIDYYPDLFQKAFGSSEVTVDKVGIALAQFIRSMSSFDSKFDQVMEEEAQFTVLEREGHDLFEQNCESACHAAPNFSTAMPLNNGLDSVNAEFADPGMGAWSGNPGDIGKFKSPSLRNIEFSAPYMHDGRFNTLEDVVNYYSEDVNAHPNADFGWVGQGGNFTGFDFTDREKEALVAFMKTLTTPDLLTDKKWSDPFDSASSTDDDFLDAAVEVYPNPVSESFTLDLGDLTNQPVALNMFDMAGKLVWKDQTTGGTKQNFNVGKLTPGVYLLKMNVDGKQLSKKILFK